LQPQLEGAGSLSGFTDGAGQPIDASDITLAGGPIVVTAIPEPENIIAAFLAAGLMGGVLWRRRLRVSSGQ
jgi:MYXO-CTERM domain-containing protein